MGRTVLPSAPRDRRGRAELKPEAFLPADAATSEPLDADRFGHVGID
ncbi:hypothetical protein [Streptosporangium sp. NPDC087985]